MTPFDYKCFMEEGKSTNKITFLAAVSEDGEYYVLDPVPCHTGVGYRVLKSAVKLHPHSQMLCDSRGPTEVFLVSLDGKTLCVRMSVVLASEIRGLTPFVLGDKQSIVDESKRWIGTPYLLGGDSKAGIDCSHHVTRAIQACDSTFSYITASEFRTSPLFSDVTSPENGDIVSWSNPLHVAVVTQHPRSNPLLLQGLLALFRNPSSLGHTRSSS